MKCSICDRGIWRFWCWMVTQEEDHEFKTHIWCAECHASFREGFPEDELIIFDDVLKTYGNNHPDKDHTRFPVKEFDKVLG